MSIANNNFTLYLTQSNVSLYQISQETGIPYTNINKLKNNKQNINNCSGEDLYKLSQFFKCKIEDLLNPIPYISHSKGLYRSIKYRWFPKDYSIVLQILKNEKYYEINRIDSQRYIRQGNIMQALAELMIDVYIEENESEDLLCQIYMS